MTVQLHRRLFLLLAFLVLSAPMRGAAEGQEADAAVSRKSEIRSIGYSVGDLAQQKVVVHTPRGYRLDESSLPVIGKTSGYVELRNARWESQDEKMTTRHDLTLDWQIFQVLPEVRPYALRPLALQFRRGEELLAVHVDAPSVMVSSFLPVVMKPAYMAPQADIAAALRQVRNLQSGVIAALCGLLLSTIYFAWRFDWLRLGRSARRPFRRACREIRSMRKTGSMVEQSLAAMRILRRACDASAGVTLSMESLHVLFRRNPWLMPLRVEVEGFYDESERVFFAGSTHVPSLDQLSALGRRLRALETQ
ncbi:mxaA protein [Methylophilaceae bacterium]|nr:mxaA protein [Methylophilaceae bacterium]